MGLYLTLKYGIPWLQKRSQLYSYPTTDKKGNPRTRQRAFHPYIYVFYTYIRVLTITVPLWFIFADLLFSSGWKNPFITSNWNGIQVPGWLFDLVYSRANDQPNGAHLISYIGVPIFGLVVAYKFVRWPPQTMNDLVGDPFQGLAAGVFLGAVHEAIWIVFYYAAYWPYLSWSLLPEVVRDVSFVGLVFFLLLTFWKMPGRSIPLRLFKWPVFLFVIYCVGWFVIPPIFGYAIFPITTINNPNFGIGVFQETPWFSYWWVNAIEVVSWLILWIPFVILVWRYKPIPK